MVLSATCERPPALKDRRHGKDGKFDRFYRHQEFKIAANRWLWINFGEVSATMR